GQDQVVALVLGEGGHLHGHVVAVLGGGVHAHGIVRADGERLADGGLGLGPAHVDGRNAAALGFLEFEAAHQGVPFIVGVHDELHPGGVVGGVVVGEGDARRGVRHVGNEDEYLHGCSAAIGPQTYS